MTKNTPPPSKRQKKRSLAIALGLVAFVVLVYVLTLIKMGPQILDKPL